MSRNVSLSLVVAWEGRSSRSSGKAALNAQPRNGYHHVMMHVTFPLEIEQEATMAGKVFE